MKAGVAILAVDDDDHARLIRLFRYALGRDSLEVVSGGIDGDEPPLAAAQRELHEELGLTAGDWQELGRINLDTSIVHGPVWLFLARDLQPGSPEREGSEVITPQTVPLATAIAQALSGEITHSPSCVALLRAALRLRG